MSNKSNQSKVLENVQTQEVEQPKTLEQRIVDHVTNNKMSTSAVIRYVASSLKAEKPDHTFQSLNGATYNFLKKHLPNVTTKSGGEIRYQHVRGVMVTPVGGSN
jgi:hypothetical protein